MAPQINEQHKISNVSWKASHYGFMSTTMASFTGKNRLVINARRLAAELLARRNTDVREPVCALLQFAEQVRSEAAHALPQCCICRACVSSALWNLKRNLEELFWLCQNMARPTT